MLVSYKKIFEKMYERSLTNGSRLQVYLKPHWEAQYKRPDSMIKNDQWTLNIGGAATATGVHVSDFGITFAVRISGVPFTFDLPWGSFFVDVDEDIYKDFGTNKISTYSDMMVIQAKLTDPAGMPTQVIVTKLTYQAGMGCKVIPLHIASPLTNSVEDLALVCGEHGFLKNFITTDPTPVEVVEPEPPKPRRPTLTVVK